MLCKWSPIEVAVVDPTPLLQQWILKKKKRASKADMSSSIKCPPRKGICSTISSKSREMQMINP